jgi:hypothetical protein
VAVGDFSEGVVAVLAATSVEGEDWMAGVTNLAWRAGFVAMAGVISESAVGWSPSSSVSGVGSTTVDGPTGRDGPGVA